MRVKLPPLKQLQSCIDCGDKFPPDTRRKYCKPCSHKRATFTNFVRESSCIQCGADIMKLHHNTKFCKDCSDKRRSGAINRNLGVALNDNEIARKLTAYAVKTGFLKSASDYPCCDCGKPAECYDHRDYNKPLDVDPVCRRCNSTRGKGIPFFSPHRSEISNPRH